MVGTVVGEVLSEQTGEGLADARVVLKPQGGEMTSAIGGGFIFKNLAPGSDYQLEVHKAGYEDGLYGPFVVLDDQPTRLTVALQPTDIG